MRYPHYDDEWDEIGVLGTELHEMSENGMDDGDPAFVLAQEGAIKRIRELLDSLDKR